MVMPAVSATPQSSVKSQPAMPVVPFRKATLERVELNNTFTSAIAAGQVNNLQKVIGSGYMYSILLRMVVTTAENNNDVAYNEDAPYNALANVLLQDVSGQLVNVPGYDLYIANLCNAMYGVDFWDKSIDTSLYNLVTGAGATGGSFAFVVRIPVATDRRRLLGLLGNQDRAQSYDVRADIAPSADIYATAPDNAGAVAVDYMYENYGVPNAIGPDGAQQEVYPPAFGTLHYTTSSLNPTSPAGGAQVRHDIQRIGHTIRWMALIFRKAGSRADAQAAANQPTNIQLKFGDVVEFNEPYWYRRGLMYERYGFDFPDGVLVYDAMHDFVSKAGSEMGDDYWHTQNLVQAQFLVSYPTAFGSTNNSLRIITDDLVYVTPSL